MQAPKRSFASSLLIVLITAVVVGGATYFLLNRETEKPQEELVEELEPTELESEEEEVVESEALSVETTETAKVEDECLKTYTEAPVRFSYPCDWQTNVGNKDTWSAVGTVVAQDGQASFFYPAPDFGLHEMTLVSEGTVNINGEDYAMTTYEGNGETLVLIEMGTALNEYSYDLMLAYQDSEYRDELDAILATFEF